MFKSLNSNTGESVKKTNTECQMKNVYKCINDVEERVNANCACEQSLQSQIDTINNATTVIKDEGQFNNVYTDHLNVDCPITAPGTTGSFNINGEATSASIETGNACLTGNLTVDGDTCLKGATSFECVPHLDADCINASVVDSACLQASSLDVGNIEAANINTICSCSQSATIDSLTATCQTVGNASINNATANILTATQSTLTSINNSKMCSCEADIDLLKNSCSIGTECISIPIEEDTDFYRYQIPQEFSGEAHFWNCDYSININTTNCHRNVLIVYSATNANTLRGFYRNNDDNRFYIEICSTCPIYYDYRAAQPKKFDFDDPLLICAMTDAGATYSPDCTLYCVTEVLGSHSVLMNNDKIPNGLTVCGSLKATYLEFQCAYFPGGLILDRLEVNGPSFLDGDVCVGLTCKDAVLTVCNLIDANYLNVHCTTCLGDRLAGETNYILSLEWNSGEEYYTYDDQTGEYTYVGEIEFEQWVPDTYYWKQVLEASCVKVIANSNICGQTVVNGDISQQTGNIVQCCGCYQNYDGTNTTTINADTTTIMNSDGCSYTVGNSSATFTDGTVSSTTTRKDITFTNPISKTKVSASGISSQASGHQTVINPNYIKIEDSNSHTLISADGIETPSQVVAGNLTVCGDIYQCGSSYETHAEQLYTTKDCICLRDGAEVGLSAGCYSGIEVIKYDGTNNTAITTDNTGMWCVGTSDGTMQPLATRSPHSLMCDNGIVMWCAACKCLYTSPELCDSSNVVYYDTVNKRLYTGSVGMVDACPIYWCADCQCFVTGPACHETWLCGLGPIVLGTCEIEDPITHECTIYCTIDAPAMVTAWTMDPLGIDPAVQDCCVKIINITKACYDALAVKDNCAYYMICDEWSGGLSLNNFCAGDNVSLSRVDGNLIISAQASGVLSGIYGGDYVSVTPRTGGGVTIDACAIDVSCYCAGNGITLACAGTAGDETLTIASKVCTLTQECYDAATIINDYVYITTDCCNFYYGSTKLNPEPYTPPEQKSGIPIGTVTMYYGTTAPEHWLPMDGSAIPAACTCLKAFLGSDYMPDMREAAPQMTGCHASTAPFSSGTKHDCLAVGQYELSNWGVEDGWTCDGFHSDSRAMSGSGVTLLGNPFTSTGDNVGFMKLQNVPSGCDVSWSDNAKYYGAYTGCYAGQSQNVNHGRRFGLLFIMKADEE